MIAAIVSAVVSPVGVLSVVVSPAATPPMDRRFGRVKFGRATFDEPRHAPAPPVYSAVVRGESAIFAKIT